MSRIASADPVSIAEAARILQAGGLVAFPTETVYGLGANALDVAAVRKIFLAKERPQWDPLIVHVRDAEMARGLTAQQLPPDLTERFWPGPLTLVVRKAACVPDEVTAGRPTVALRVPRHPVAQALLRAAAVPIAAPSANRFGGPSPTRAEHVAADLGDRVDLILDGGPTEVGVESTVLDLTQSPPVILRPGGVTREELGGLALAPGVPDEIATKGLAGPGMTLKHYAPRASVEVFEEEAALRQRAEQLPGRRVGLLLKPTAQNLYAELRRLDAEGVEVILALLPPAEGIGLAVRDRLVRAAGRRA
ncbi:MAG: L-threonylcarbamoyladenylate synthase [Verrucomicrobiae bacterium]|nr:L-threonylcarbamoyladenylate synthase [Verrucomicrobiae bacterium]